MMTNLRPQAQAATLLVALLLQSACAAQSAAPAESAVGLKGPLDHSEDLSAIVRSGDFWWIASDEGRALQRFTGNPSDGALATSGKPLVVLDGEGAEVDLEALAADGQQLYALGSHSLKRPRLKDKSERKKNLKKLRSIVTEPSRNHLFRIRLDASGDSETIESIDLRIVLADDPTLAPFLRIPGKENGLDLEGLAFLDGLLFAGCRSPVLRGGWVPVIVFDFAAPADYELRFVNLNGDGIRSMTQSGSELVLVSGDAQRGTGKQSIWTWNGLDALPGSEGAGGLVRRLVTLPEEATAIEGVEVIGRTADQLDVLLIRDGVARGQMTRRRIPLL